MRLWKILEIAAECDSVTDVELRLIEETEIRLSRDELLSILSGYQMDLKAALRHEICTLERGNS
ncbi:MAG: hypothetical protein CMF31_02050 [Kordiimonas sp.]|nr:hypothetical protein [Kordiimonas sp.]|tara:strand:+ start:252 stop:443 length:192 start_codon:yes stop_codon:yes gene_type:complete